VCVAYVGVVGHLVYYLLIRMWVFAMWAYGIYRSSYGVVRHSRRYLEFRGQYGGGLFSIYIEGIDSLLAGRRWLCVCVAGCHPVVRGLFWTMSCCACCLGKVA